MSKTGSWAAALALVTVGAGAAVAKGKAKAAPKTVSVTLEPKSGSKVTGKATFTEKGKQVVLHLEVEGAPPGEHAAHIHEFGDCSAPDGKSAGGHWNPTTDEHGKWGVDHFHLGDIGNMTIKPDGKGEIELTTDKWSLAEGATNNPSGKSIVVHGGVDDFKTQPTGNAGNRIACGVIGGAAAAAPAGAAPAGAAPAPAAPAKK
jgi:Cu-Zn family superoxide dismutase